MIQRIRSDRRLLGGLVLVVVAFALLIVVVVSLMRGDRGTHRGTGTISSPPTGSPVQTNNLGSGPPAGGTPSGSGVHRPSSSPSHTASTSGSGVLPSGTGGIIPSQTITAVPSGSKS